jgi:glycerol-3-phosphate acyltransferase PlsY
MTIEQSLFAAVAFALGSLPFAVWIGRLALRKDVRDYGDGNPGAFNVMRAGGIGWGTMAVALDVSKGAAPVGFAYHVLKWDGLPMLIIAVAPIFGHAFSPLLNFRGGKAIASTGGMWVGLSLWQIPLVGGSALILIYLLLNSSAWTVIFTLLVIVGYLLLSGAPELWLAAWAVSGALLIYKHRKELNRLPGLRPEIRRRLGLGGPEPAEVNRKTG